MSVSAEPSLLVVSNRLPVQAERRGRTVQWRAAPGGLVSALDPVLRTHGGVWVGWPGISREDSADTGSLAIPAPAGVAYAPVELSEHELSAYYGGFANRTLWPLFHYFVGRTVIDGAAWRAYEQVNERFARVTAEAYRPGALIWVHDYQLLRVAHHVRRLQPAAAIAFFLHIPFPAADVLRVLPWSRSILRGMLAADLVGFQVPSYADHFLACAERLLGCDVDRAAGIVRYEGREVSVQAHPISIDTAQIERLAAATPPTADSPVREILGVDRLDYTKGIHERLLAVERLLERHPGYRRRVRFTQVMVPSRERVTEYRQLKREIDEIVGRINGRFADGAWSPIRYLVRSLPVDELVPLYRRADVALVTPLRDGMNLVAKEFVAAQLENDGVLILSEMAGAAEELQEALIVNPFDLDAVADALHQALAMPEDERTARMAALRDRVRGFDVHAWVRRFLASAEVAARRARSSAESAADVVRRRLAPWLAQRPTLALFVDYDGTLTPIVSRPADARLSDAARQVLEQAARNPRLDLTIVSGRALADLVERVGLPGITYVGNHGYDIEGPGTSHRHEDGAALARIGAAARQLEDLGVPGALVENKGATVSFHLRGVTLAARRDATRRATAILRSHHLRVVSGKLVIEGRPGAEWHKGRAVLHVLVQRHGADWPSRVRAVYLGDDVTDEDAFRSLQGIGRSIRVGDAAAPPTVPADFNLPDPDAVVTLLRWLASGAFAGGPR